MSRLNEFQAQHVESTFAHVDRLLNAVEALARANTSPFARERSDVSPTEARFIAAFTQQMRTRMVAALDRLGLPRPEPKTSARHSANVTLRFAEIALADLTPSSLRGYGKVDPEAGSEVAALATDLRELIERGRALFREEDTGGLVQHVANLAGPFGEALRALERFSAENALADVRPLIADAAERVAAETFDVGVFGRVSAGKSSLINALIGSDVLPVGATPVTAVPLRLHHGALGAVVRFENDTSREVTAAGVAEYATEEHNPGNRLRVRAIEIGVPTIPVGLRLLDTPGIGSLSASAPAQAFAWLPRCDFGLMLVAAGTPVSTDDLALVSGLVHAGIACRVLVSKSDLLNESDVVTSLAYVQRELHAVLGGAEVVPVSAVSTVSTAASSLALFRTAVLEPLIEGHATALHEALRRRLHRLVALTRAALAEGEGMPAGMPSGEDDETRNVSVRRHARREAALAAIRTRTDALSGDGQRVIERAASAAASAWIEKRNPATAVRASIIRDMGAALNAVRDAVDQATANPGNSSDAARANTLTVGTLDTSASGAERRLPPVFDATFLDQLPDLSPPRLLSAPRRTLAERRLEGIRAALNTDLSRYAARLYAWGEQALREAVVSANDSSGAPQSAAGPEADVLARIAAMIDGPV